MPAPTPRLIALDMDGTLLDGEGRIPAGFNELAAQLHDSGAVLVPASGRQLATLRDMFAEIRGIESFIAENGTVVSHHGQVVDTTQLPTNVVTDCLTACENIDRAHTYAVVLCAPETAYVAAGTPAGIRAEIDKYYHSVTVVDDLAPVAAAEPLVKLAVYCTADSEEHVAPHLRAAAAGNNLAISGKNWLDVMSADADKGHALEQLAAKLGIPMEQTAAFGDYLNDFQLLQAAGTAVAMENAHPRLKEIADLQAPSNLRNGVLEVLRDWFGE
ncbi:MULTISPECIES: HAD family hydrolase [unclassified Corynebacterium]|uniref:HAD family hydrolase n=1 Tax=unclassified Corynebacterium TaxID=2624378 RepID=UPI0034CF95AE